MPQLHKMQIYFIKKPHQIEINGLDVYITTRSRQFKLTAPFLLGGETGIRTLGPASWSTVFETAPIDHSGISPFLFQVLGTRSNALFPLRFGLQKYTHFWNHQEKK